jgi:hypothetical protein
VSLGIKLQEMTQKAEHAEVQWLKMKSLPDQLEALKVSSSRGK